MSAADVRAAGGRVPEAGVPEDRVALAGVPTARVSEAGVAGPGGRDDAEGAGR